MRRCHRKCHGSHSIDRKDKYNDKYKGKDKDRDKTDKDKNVGEGQLLSSVIDYNPIHVSGMLHIK